MSRMTAIYAVFFLEAFVLGNWIPRIPAVKTLFGLSASQLGLCLFALAFGTLLAFGFGGAKIKRWGLRATCRWALVAWAMGIGFVPWMGTMPVLIPLLILAGIAIGFCEIAMNTAADQWERDTGKRVMSKAHGFWSLGSLFGAIVGAAFASQDFAVWSHFAIVMPLVALAAIWMTSALPGAGDRLPPQTTTFSLPRADLVLLCLMPVGIMLVEGAFIDWSALFVQDVLLGSPVAVGAIYAAFSSVMAATRLSGDILLDRFGPMLVARVSAVSAAVGIALFAFAPNVEIAFLGALFSGLGVAIFYPLTMSEAAKRPGDAEDNVAAMSLFAFTSFMIAPPLLGFIADAAGLRFALALLIPLTVLSLALTGELRKKPVMTDA